MRSTTRHLAVLALGAVAFLWSTATAANADGFGDHAIPFGSEQTAECRTSAFENAAITFTGIPGLVGEDSFSTTCHNRTDRTPDEQLLKCKTDPTANLVTPVADRTFRTSCSNVAHDDHHRHVR